MEKKKNPWKAWAIVFLVIAILEGFTLGYFISAGIEGTDNEYDCALNVCEDYPSYYYDWTYETCQCYEDNELVKTTYMG